MKNHSDEIFVEQLGSIKFPDYSNFTCVSDAHHDFIAKFLSIVDFVAPIKIL